MPKIDFGSIILSLACAVLITIVFILAITNIVNCYVTNSAEASMYSRPSWYETTMTTEETIESEVEETC